MNLELAPETAEYARELRRWSVEQLRPHARAADRAHAVSADAIEAYRSRPFTGSPNAGSIRVPALEGTTDGTYVIATTVVEHGTYGDSIFGCLDQTGIGAKVVRLIGSPEQVERWGHTDGFTGFALTEPEAGSDAASLRTSAAQDGDRWVLNGSKMFCSGGALSEYVVVFATVDRSLGYNGIRSFVVPADTPGFTVVKANEEKLGMRAMCTSLLAFDDVRVPDENCLGVPDSRRRAFGRALATLNTTRHQVASIAVGLAQAAIDEARPLLQAQKLSYSPARWERIQADLAAMDAALHNGRLLIRNAAQLLDRGLPFSREASVAKAAVPPLAERIIARILRILGPDGYSEELLFEKWHRDVKIIDIWEGTGQIQRRTISRSLMGSGAAAG